MEKNILDYYEDFADFFDDEQQAELQDFFDSIQFKLNRTKYHFNQIKHVIRHAGDPENDNYYDEVHLPIYYEMEGFLVSLRSTIDILLHLINFTFQLGLSGYDVQLHNVYRHRKLPKALKNIFDRYTRPYNNPVWTFIYTFRNETVHEKSIHQVLPIHVDMFTEGNEPLVFFIHEDAEREIKSFFNNCIRFLETFNTQMFQAMKISL